MSDYLLERLKDWENIWACDMGKPEGALHEEAADRIEALQAENKRLREALEGIHRCTVAQNATDDEARGWIEVEARKALDD